MRHEGGVEGEGGKSNGRREVDREHIRCYSLFLLQGLHTCEAHSLFADEHSGS